MTAEPDGLDLEALEAVARAATPGPWEASGAGVTNWHDFTYEMEWISNGGPGGRDCKREISDAAHIATFDPPTVLALIARIREAERWQALQREDIITLGARVGRAEALVEGSEVSYEVYQDDMIVAQVEAGDEGAALREARHYALVYSQDWPVMIKRVTRLEIATSAFLREEEGEVT